MALFSAQMAVSIPDAQLDSFAHRLKDAVVIITGMLPKLFYVALLNPTQLGKIGGANGIGRATALHCAKFGYGIQRLDLLRTVVLNRNLLQCQDCPW
jgi:hypothetical protein